MLSGVDAEQVDDADVFDKNFQTSLKAKLKITRIQMSVSHSFDKGKFALSPGFHSLNDCS